MGSFPPMGSTSLTLARLWTAALRAIPLGVTMDEVLRLSGVPTAEVDGHLELGRALWIYRSPHFVDPITGKARTLEYRFAFLEGQLVSKRAVPRRRGRGQADGR